MHFAQVIDNIVWHDYNRLMSIMLELKYVHLLRHRVDQFTQKDEMLFNFRCPICGDSKKSKTKKRGYIFPSENRQRLIYKCHNCGASLSFIHFLKQYFPDLFEEFRREKIEEKLAEKSSKKQSNNVEKKQEPISLDAFRLVVSGIKIPKHAKEYLLSRKIDERDIEKYAVYTNQCALFLQKLFPQKEKYKKMKAHGNYVGIMCLTKEKLNGIVFRSLAKYNQLRYVSVKIRDPYIFGLDRIDKYDTVFVFEGVFDALMVPNGVAALCSDLMRIEKHFQSKRVVYVFDNEIRKNKEIRKLVKRAIENDKEVVLFPEHIRGKDLNEMIMSGEVEKDNVLDFLNEHIYKGLRARIKFSEILS